MATAIRCLPHPRWNTSERAFAGDDALEGVVAASLAALRGFARPASNAVTALPCSICTLAVALPGDHPTEVREREGERRGNLEGEFNSVSSWPADFVSSGCW